MGVLEYDVYTSRILFHYFWFDIGTDSELIYFVYNRDYVVIADINV